MTPKEKASDLYNRFYSYDSHPHSVGVREERSKECALICVDEVLRIIIFASTPKCHLHEEQTFWSQVKEEINKL